MTTNLKIILPFGHTGKVHQLRCTLLYGYDWFIIWSTAVAIKLFKIIATYIELGRGCGSVGRAVASNTGGLQLESAIGTIF